MGEGWKRWEIPTVLEISTGLRRPLAGLAVFPKLLRPSGVAFQRQFGAAAGPGGFVNRQDNLDALAALFAVNERFAPGANRFDEILQLPLMTGKRDGRRIGSAAAGAFTVRVFGIRELKNGLLDAGFVELAKKKVSSDKITAFFVAAKPRH